MPANATLRAGSVPLSSLAATLSIFANRVVVDRTGLAGGFDVILTWTPNQTAETSGASLFTALQEQLGTLSARVQETVAGMTAVRAYAMERAAAASFVSPFDTRRTGTSSGSSRCPSSWVGCTWG